MNVMSLNQRLYRENLSGLTLHKRYAHFGALGMALSNKCLFFLCLGNQLSISLIPLLDGECLIFCEYGRGSYVAGR